MRWSRPQRRWARKSSGPSLNYGGVRTPLHPRSLRCSSVACLRACALLAPCARGAGPLSASPHFRDGPLGDEGHAGGGGPLMAPPDLPEHPKGALRSGNIADELARGPRHLHVVVVSPAQPIFEGDVHWVTVPAWDGQLGIWPGHAAIVAALGSGLLRIGQDGGKVARFAVRGGFLKVGGGKVTILVDSAVAEADVDTAEARRELDETVAALRHPKTDEEFEELLDRRAWSESRLKLGGA